MPRKHDVIGTNLITQQGPSGLIKCLPRSEFTEIRAWQQRGIDCGEIPKCVLACLRSELKGTWWPVLKQLSLVLLLWKSLQEAFCADRKLTQWSVCQLRWGFVGVQLLRLREEQQRLIVQKCVLHTSPHYPVLVWFVFQICGVFYWHEVNNQQLHLVPVFTKTL